MTNNAYGCGWKTVLNVWLLFFVTSELATQLLYAFTLFINFTLISRSWDGTFVTLKMAAQNSQSTGSDFVHQRTLP